MNKDREEAKKWLKDCVDKNGRNLENSKIFAAIVTDIFLDSPECALQLGLAMIMDKPIALIVDKNTKIPSNLIKVAQLIERVDTSSKADLERASTTLKSFMESLK